MAQTNGVSQVHRDLKSQQMKLQSHIDELHQAAKEVRSQNELARNDLDRLKA